MTLGCNHHLMRSRTIYIHYARCNQNPSEKRTTLFKSTLFHPFKLFVLIAYITYEKSKVRVDNQGCLVKKSTMHLYTKYRVHRFVVESFAKSKIIPKGRVRNTLWYTQIIHIEL